MDQAEVLIFPHKKWINQYKSSVVFTLKRMINALVIHHLDDLTPYPKPICFPQILVCSTEKKNIFCSPGNHRPRKHQTKMVISSQPSPQCTRPGSSPPSSAPYPGSGWRSHHPRWFGRWGFLNHQLYVNTQNDGFLEFFLRYGHEFGIYSLIFWGWSNFLNLVFWNKSKKTNRNKRNNYSALSFETRSKRGKGAAKSSISMRPAGPQTRSRQ